MQCYSIVTAKQPVWMQYKSPCYWPQFLFANTFNSVKQCVDLISHPNRYRVHTLLLSDLTLILLCGNVSDSAGYYASPPIAECSSIWQINIFRSLPASLLVRTLFWLWDSTFTMAERKVFLNGKLITRVFIQQNIFLFNSSDMGINLCCHNWWVTQ